MLLIQHPLLPASIFVKKAYEKKVIIFLGVLTSVTFLVLYLYLTNARATYRAKGGFERTKKILANTLHSQVPLAEDFYTFAGCTETKLYLWGRQRNSIFEVPIDNPNISDTREFALSGFAAKSNITNISLAANNRLNIFLGNDKKILVYDLGTKTIERQISTDFFFSNGYEKSNTWLLQVQKDTSRQSRLAKFQETKGKLVEISVPEFIINGVADAGKDLTYGNGSVVHVSSYSNHIVSSDSTLGNITRASTIDTNRQNPRVVWIPDKRILTFSEQPRLVNNNAWIYGPYLCVQSMIEADNDSYDVLKDFNIVDLYIPENDFKYLHSIYLPASYNSEATDILLLNKKIFLLYNSALLTYTTDEAILQH